MAVAMKRLIQIVPCPYAEVFGVFFSLVLYMHLGDPQSPP